MVHCPNKRRADSVTRKCPDSHPKLGRRKDKSECCYKRMPKSVAEVQRRKCYKGKEPPCQAPNKIGRNPRGDRCCYKDKRRQFKGAVFPDTPTSPFFKNMDANELMASLKMKTPSRSASVGSVRSARSSQSNRTSYANAVSSIGSSASRSMKSALSSLNAWTPRSVSSTATTVVRSMSPKLQNLFKTPTPSPRLDKLFKSAKSAVGSMSPQLQQLFKTPTPSPRLDKFFKTPPKVERLVKDVANKINSISPKAHVPVTRIMSKVKEVEEQLKILRTKKLTRSMAKQVQKFEKQLEEIKRGKIRV